MNSYSMKKVSGFKQFFEKFSCANCDSIMDSGYTLKDEVWYQQLKMKHDQNLCIPCLLELKPDISINDFAEVPGNNMIKLGFILGRKYHATQYS